MKIGKGSHSQLNHIFGPRILHFLQVLPPSKNYEKKSRLHFTSPTGLSGAAFMILLVLNLFLLFVRFMPLSFSSSLEIRTTLLFFFACAPPFMEGGGPAFDSLMIYLRFKFYPIMRRCWTSPIFFLVITLICCLFLLFEIHSFY